MTKRTRTCHSDPIVRADPQTRLWLLRALRHIGVGLATSPSLLADELAASMGFSTAPADDGGWGPVRARLDRSISALEARPALRRGRFHDNVARIARVASLSALEADVLAVVCRLGSTAFSRLDDVFWGAERCERVIAAALARPAASVARALTPGATLRRAGLVHIEAHHGREAPYEPTARVRRSMPLRCASDADMLEAFAPRASPATWELADFHGQRDAIALAAELLRRAVGPGAVHAPTHILLHGAPGTGKTELARALAAAVDARLHEVAVSDDDGEACDRAQRLAHLAACQQVLGLQVGAMLVCDEAEDIFPRESPLFGARSMANKGFVTRLLETSSVPCVWITNAPEAIDEAILRRFQLIVAVEAPHGHVRERMVKGHLQGVPVSDATVASLCKDTRLAPAMVARAASVARAVATSGTANGAVSVDRAVELVTEGFWSALGQAPRAADRASTLAYDPAFIRAVPAIDDVVRGVVSGGVSQASLLLLGPPGSGKTELVRQLSSQAGRPLLERRASDLLSKWLGETERLIARMFQEARAQRAVLFLDEADTFLSGRADARQPWQVSQTNELLTQMAEFDGLFICATNLKDRIDAAAFRRFDLKVSFEPLAAEARAVLLQRAFAPALGSGVAALVARADDVGGLVIGDVVAVLRGLALRTGVSAQDVLCALREEVAHRRGADRGRIGFGADLTGPGQEPWRGRGADAQSV